MAELSIIIVSHSHGSLLIKLLDSLANQKPSFEFKIQLMLNSIEDQETLSFLSKVKLNLQISHRKTPHSLSSNLNTCINEVNTSYTLILNPDVILPSENLEQIMQFLKSSKLDLATCPAKSPDNQELVNLRYFPSPLSLFYERITSEGLRLKMQQNILEQPSSFPFWIQGSYLIAPSSTFKELNFDERFPLYFEDVDFCRRLLFGGKRIGVCRETYFIHHFQRKSSRVFSKHFMIHLYSAFLYFIKYRFSKPTSLQA